MIDGMETTPRTATPRGPTLAVALLLLAGCGGPDLDLPPLAAVTGAVTLDGRPLPRAMVQFVPDESRGTKGPPAMGYSDEEGRYELKSAGEEGAMVGFHRVLVEARAAPKDETDTMPALLTPQKYASESTSGLAFEVKAGEENEIDLSLTTN